MLSSTAGRIGLNTERIAWTSPITSTYPLTRAYRAQYGEDRLDVANHFNVPAYQKSGFKFTVPAGAIGKGRHELRVRVILSDRNAYQEGVPVPLEIQ